MNANFDHSWECLENTLAARLPLREAWHRVVDFHAQRSAKDYWPLIRAEDIEAERDAVLGWWQTLLRNEPPPREVSAVWVGLFKFIDEAHPEETYAMYLTGCDAYDADDIEWTIEPVYEPEGRYFVPGGLNRIGALLHLHEKDDHDTFCLLDWILPLAWCALLLDDITRNRLINRTLFPENREHVFISAGFDDGDYLALTPIT